MYDSMYDELAEIMMELMGFFVVVFVICAAVAILLYVLQSLGYQKIAKNRGMNSPWIAWIPFARTYQIGAIADDINDKESSKRSWFRFILLGLSLGGIVLRSMVLLPMIRMFGQLFQMAAMGYFDAYSSYELEYLLEDMMYSQMDTANSISSLSSLVGLGTTVAILMTLHRIFKCYNPGSATVWTVLCFFFPFLQNIFPFSIRNKEPVPVYQPVQPGYAPPGGYPQQGYPQQGWQQQPPPSNPQQSYPQQGWQQQAPPPNPQQGYPPNTAWQQPAPPPDPQQGYGGSWQQTPPPNPQDDSPPQDGSQDDTTGGPEY